MCAYADKCGSTLIKKQVSPDIDTYNVSNPNKLDRDRSMYLCYITYRHLSCCGNAYFHEYFFLFCSKSALALSKGTFGTLNLTQSYDSS